MKDIKKKISGICRQLENKIVCFREDVIARADDDASVVSIPKGTVGTLTGGFTNKLVDKRLVSWLDVQVNISKRSGGSTKRHLLIVSVPINYLQIGMDDKIN